ncbi:1-deoxy-D-xylulose-5-phosphate reductoisomerase [Candidatus Woesearchaeota archaeon]|nr:1-deoxy-D-xylulose-5-phosphate reductoisomerase [Candidatus Woesearchaeota archaeon]
MKELIILGSTGSIGRQALEIVRQHPGEFRIKALSCGSNTSLLKKQIQEFNPDAVAVCDEQAAAGFSSDSEVFSGLNGILKLVKEIQADTALNALVGSIGVKPTAEAIKAGKNIALANKETLVAAGDQIMPLLKKFNVSLKPIDSEHSAIFQCLQGEQKGSVKSVTLTCSGGPFLGRKKTELSKVTAKEALNHPKWKMGDKITIDSATLMNKGLEVIEAHHLFCIPYENINVVVHPESVIHSFVEFQDTSIKAQLGYPDMRIPIQYALSHPKRFSANLKSLRPQELGMLQFSPPDVEAFPCLSYAYEAGKAGGSLACVMNAANEAVVKLFLEGKIGFLDIPRIIKEQMQGHKPQPLDIDELMELDARTKKKVLG